MKLLLDTNVFLWLVQQEPIPAGVLAQLEDPSAELYASLANAVVLHSKNFSSPL